VNAEKKKQGKRQRQRFLTFAVLFRKIPEERNSAGLLQTSSDSFSCLQKK
jgi:hypothetical protein